jgi:hypothetical protein
LLLPLSVVLTGCDRSLTLLKEGQGYKRTGTRRELLLGLSQCGAEALSEYLGRQVGTNARPAIVVSIATSSDLLQWHPHGHILVTDGAFSDDGAFHPFNTWDGDRNINGHGPLARPAA